MQRATTFSLTLLRLCGVIQIVLGVMFWTGNAQSLIPLHMQIGFVLVLTLWLLAAMAARARVDARAIAIAVLWGVLVPVLGLTQARLLPGDGHWVIQVVHLLLGLGAIGQGEGLAARIGQIGRTTFPELPAPAPAARRESSAR